MCAWTAPQPDAGARSRACHAALDAIQGIERFNARHAPFRLPTRIGLHAGWVYVGHAGGGGRFVFGVIGDIANTASRIEDLNKHVGTHLLASATVVDGLDDLLVRPLGDFLLAGKSEPLAVFEILARAAEATAAEADLCGKFGEALQAFRGRAWNDAAERLERLLDDFPGDGPSTFYLARCRQNLEAPAGVPTTVICMDEK
jgi:adenylate cyclase